MPASQKCRAGDRWVIHTLAGLILLPAATCSSTPPSPAESTDSGTSGGLHSTSTAMTGNPPTTGLTPLCGGCGKTTVFEGDLFVAQDLKGYECVSEVEGDVDFVGPITDVEMFKSLRRVSGTLTINGAPCDLRFLPCLETVGALNIEYASECLHDLAGLEKLTTIESLLRIAYVDGVASLDGLNHVTSGPKQLELKSLPVLSSFAALTLPASMGSVQLIDLPNLASLSGLSTVEAVDTLTLSRLKRVPTLTGLENVKSVKRLEVGICPGAGPSEGLDALQDLSGLDNLASVDILSISGNDSLVTLQGAPALVDMGNVVIVANGMVPDAAIVECLAQNSNPSADTCFGAADTCSCPE